MPDEQKEMDQSYRERIQRLLNETTENPRFKSQEAFLAAYTAVLLKDAVSLLSELLTTEQIKASNGQWHSPGMQTRSHE